MQPCDIETKKLTKYTTNYFPSIYFHFEDGCFRSWAGGAGGQLAP